MSSPFDDRRFLIPFRSQLLPHVFTDVLVIGGGVAGMRAAVAAAQHGRDVIMLHKSELDQSNTAWAQGGIAAAIDDSDSPAAHVRDTLATGVGLCQQSIVEIACNDGVEEVERLVRIGMRFDRAQSDGALSLGREGGHHANRILHAGGAATGVELVRCLAQSLEDQPAIRRFDHCFAIDLLTLRDAAGALRSNSNQALGSDEVDDNQVLGAITWHPRYGLQIIWARATILATGGLGQVYRETTNPREATGDGLAMAYRAGACIGDVEFVQFHPTTLYVAGAERLLISEAVRGEGVHLVDRSGKRFMEGQHELAELAPRDVVSRAILDQLARTQDSAVYLDARHLPAGRFVERFPNLHRRLASFDLDPARDLIPVHPSAHYSIGGVWTDAHGRTNLRGLYAVGEAACNGLHGANRLASNSLLEGLVFGRRAAEAAEEMTDQPIGPVQIISDMHFDEHGELDIVDVRQSLRSVMWRNVGIDRTGTRLRDVMDMFDFWARYTLATIFDDPAGWETQNLLTVGSLITRAAAWRCESRGTHSRRDHEQTLQRYAVHGRWRSGLPEPDELAVELKATTRQVCQA